MDIMELMQDRYQLVKEAEALLKAADKRGASDVIGSSLQGRLDEINKLTGQIGDGRYLKATADNAANVIDGMLRYLDQPANEAIKPDPDPRNNRRYAGGWQEDSKGNRFKIFERDEEFRSTPEYRLPDGIRPEELSMGRWLKAIATGETRGAEAEMRAMGESTGAGGGYVVPEPLADKVIESAKNKLAVQRAGARLVAMESATHDTAMVNGTPTAYWTAENTNLTESSITFERLRLDAKKAGTYLLISNELMEDGKGLDEVLNDELGYAVAAAADYAALEGDSNAGEPDGILNTSGIQSATLSAAITLDNIGTGYWEIISENGPEKQSMIYNSDVGKKLSALKNGDGLYLLNAAGGTPDYWTQIKRLVSNQIATSSNNTTVYLGDFTQLLWGVRRGIRIVASNVAGDALKADQTMVQITWRGDFGLVRPAWFYVFKSVDVS